MKIRFTVLFFFLIYFQNAFFAQTVAPEVPPGGRIAGSPAPSANVTVKKGNSAGVMDGNENMVTSYTATACGLNYISTNFNLNQRSAANYPAGAVQPAFFMVSGIPLCGKIFKAFLYTGGEGNAPFVINASITNPLGSNSIFPMALIGTAAGKNWGYTNSYAYRADITSVITGNGLYSLSGIPVAPSGMDANGASLFIVYTDEAQNYTGSIVIADGMVSNQGPLGDPFNVTISGFNVCGNPISTTNFMILDDLQNFNAIDMGLNSGTVNYTQAQGTQTPWMLISQPGNAVVNGQTTASYNALGGGDAIGMVMTGMYFRTGCLTCPNPMTLTATSATCTPNGSATVTTAGGLTPLTYTWSGSAATTSVATGLTPGPHTITVRDQNGCKTRTTTVNVTIPSTITVPNASLCIGYSTTLNAGPTNSYTWSPGASLNTTSGPSVIANPMVTTIYTVLSTNSLNCVSTNTVQLLVSPSQTITVSNPTACINSDLVLVGSSTYTGATYQWQGPLAYNSGIVGSSTVTRTPANAGMGGNYTLTVVSLPGCTTTAFATATIFALPSLTITSNSPVCQGQNLSMVGSGAVDYVWYGPNNFTSNWPNPTVMNPGVVASGIYTLIAAYANGCANTITQSLTVNPLPVPVIGYNDPLCAGKTLSLTAGGATTYTWTGPNAFSSTLQNPTIANISALGAGTYSLLVSMASCTAVTNTLVTVNPLPVPTAINSGPVCATNSVQLIGGGGATYTWSGPGSYGSTIQSPVLSSPQVSNTGVYSLTVADAIGCEASITTSLTILGNPLVSATGTNVCYNAPGTLTVTGGASYYWEGPNSFTSIQQMPTVTQVDNLTSGVYQVTVTGNNACTSVISASLGTIPLPTIAVTSTAACFGAASTTLGASGAVTYTWAGPNAFFANGPIATIPIANVNSTGAYTVVGTAPNTCTNEGIGSLATIPLPTLATTGTIVCLRDPAVLTSTATAGSTYSWTGPGGYVSPNTQDASIVSANNVAVNIYTVVVTGPNTCTTSATAQLATMPLPTVTAPGTVICLNEPYTLVASGAVSYSWAGPNNFILNNSPTAFIANVNAQTVGNYTLTGMALNGCFNTNTGNIIIASMPLPTITAVGSTVCFGKPTVLQSGGGVGGGYTWTGPNNYSSAAQNAFIAVVDNVSNGVYTVVGTAMNTCTNSATAILGFNPLPVPVIIAPQRVCFRSSMTLQGQGAKTYTWTGPYNYYSANRTVTLPIYNMQQGGTYTLSVLDSLGCAAYTTTLIKIDPIPTGNLSSDNKNNYCVPFCSKFKIENTTISPIVNSSWLVNNRIFVGDTFTYCLSKATENFVIGTFTNALGCANTVTFSIDAYPKPVADYVYTPDKPLENLDVIEFKNTTEGEKQIDWDWYFVSNKGFVGSGQSVSYSFNDAGSYEVALVVTNTWGCADTVVKSIVVSADVKLYVPNAFTPNGDGLNDTFQPKGRGIQKYRMTIFDRWSNIVFESAEITKGWDGTLRGSACTDDVYVWKIYTVDDNGKVKEMTGFVSVTR